MKTKLEEIVDLIDAYVWCTRGSDLNDDYSITEEDDFDQFKEELKKLLEDNHEQKTRDNSYSL